MAQDTKNIIAFQGIAGANSDIACKRAYPYMTALPTASFEDVFDAVKSGKAAMALLPIENSHAGRVAEIHNMLPSSGLSIVGEYFHKVRHNLVGTKDSSLDTVKIAYSHIQALMQCRENIRKLGVTSEPFYDTAAAAKAVAEWKDPTKAAISSDLAAELYGLKILKADVQDADNNTTLFIAVSKEPLEPDAKTKNLLTTIVFTTRNIAAGLYKALGGFATNNVNLVKLESYIPDYNGGTAQFLITFEGHPEQKNVQQAIEELGFFTKNVHLLGVYPADPERYKGK